MASQVTPVGHGSVDIGRAIQQAWEAVKANAAAAILGYLVYALITGVGNGIPYAGLLVAAFVDAPLIGGLTILFLNLVNRKQPSVADIFTGFKSYASFLGAFWLMILVCYVPMIPGAGLIGIGAVVSQSAEGAGIVLIVLGVAVALAGMVVAFIFMMRWLFVFWIIAEGWEGGAVIPAFKRSAQITEGHRWMLLLAMIVFGIVGVAGMIACCVGILFTAPLAGCAMTSVYNDLKNAHMEASVPLGAVPPPAPPTTPPSNTP